MIEVTHSECHNFIQYMLSTLFFFSLLFCYRAPVAQLVEHRTVTREVASSTPAGPTLRVFKQGWHQEFFSLGPGTRMSGQIGVPSIFWGSQNLGDSLRVKKESYEKEIEINQLSSLFLWTVLSTVTSNFFFPAYKS